MSLHLLRAGALEEQMGQAGVAGVRNAGKTGVGASGQRDSGAELAGTGGQGMVLVPGERIEKKQVNVHWRQERRGYGGTRW